MHANNLNSFHARNFSTGNKGGNSFDEVKRQKIK